MNLNAVPPHVCGALTLASIALFCGTLALWCEWLILKP